MSIKRDNILREIIWLRLSQMYVNELYKDGKFKIPVHLALGHESIAVAVDHTMKEIDSLFLTHRNIHYNLARLKFVKEDIEEYLLKDSGLGGSFLGSMNLHNLEKNIIKLDVGEYGEATIYRIEDIDSDFMEYPHSQINKIKDEEI